MMRRLALFLCFGCLLLVHWSAAAAACADPDCFASVPHLISEKGYPVESHDVVTSDGYILTMHRIPRPGAPAVLLQHGLLDASETWVVNDANNRCATLLGIQQQYSDNYDANNSLGFMLHDAGFDVFLVIQHPCSAY
jgi:hypothetical protein